MIDLKFIPILLMWALTLGAAGGLIDLTIQMSKNAWQANHVGIVSMKELTNQLMSPDTQIQELKGIKHYKK